MRRRTILARNFSSFHACIDGVSAVDSERASWSSSPLLFVSLWPSCSDCWDDDISRLGCSRLVQSRHEYVLLTVRTRNLLLISCCIGPDILVKLYVAYMKVLKDKEKTDIHEIRREHKSGIFRGLGILKTNSRFAAVMARLGVNTKDNMFATPCSPR